MTPDTLALTRLNVTKTYGLGQTHIQSLTIKRELLITTLSDDNDTTMAMNVEHNPTV